MAVYIPKDKNGRSKTAIYQFDFKVRVKGATESTRFFGSTGVKDKKAARRVEDELRELAKLGKLQHAMTMAEATEKYWDEQMSNRRSADSQAVALEHLCRFLGPDTRLVDLDSAKIAAAAARYARTPIMRWHRGLKKNVPTKLLPKPASVNRQIVELARRLLRYAKIVWKVPIDLEAFDWKAIKYEEPAERVREFSTTEEDRYWGRMREDYHPIIEMYLISGRRKCDWVMLKKELVDLALGTVTMDTHKRKHAGTMSVTLTPRELEIIWEEWQKAPDSIYVFTYVVRRPDAVGKGFRKGVKVGARRPINKYNLRRAHKTACKRAGISNFRIHDFRHTFASRLLRRKSNLKLVQKALDHADIASTLRYTHVLDREVVDARSEITVSRSRTGVANQSPAVNQKRIAGSNG